MCRGARPPGGRRLSSPCPPQPTLALSRPLWPSEKLAALKVEAEEIALTAASQRRKLEVVLEAANQSLQVEEPQVKWSVESTWARPGLVSRGGLEEPGSFCSKASQ